VTFQNTNLMHNSFILQQYICYTKLLNMSRAARCPSSGGPILSPQPLVSSPSVSSRTVCGWRADCLLSIRGFRLSYYLMVKSIGTWGKGRTLFCIATMKIIPISTATHTSASKGYPSALFYLPHTSNRNSQSQISKGCSVLVLTPRM